MDHGGDSVLETSSAVWICSKGAPLSDSSVRCQPISYRPRLSRGSLCLIVSFNKSFLFRQFCSSWSSLSHSTTWEALFEVFHRGDDGSELTAALELNANQIERYLDVYRLSTSGQGYWLAGWIHSWHPPTVECLPLVTFNRLALSTSRSLWA